MCPSPVSGGMGFAPAPEAPDPVPARTGGALKPCRGRAPELPSGALESPRRGHGSRVARGLLQPPSTGSSGTGHDAAAPQPAPPPASCSAAPPQHDRLARSEATRRRRSAQATRASRRSSCTCSGSRCKLRLAASGVLRISRRRGKGLRGHGGLGRLIFCTCFQAPTPASPASFATAQDGRSDSPPTRRCSPANPCCLSQQRRRQRKRSR